MKKKFTLIALTFLSVMAFAYQATRAAGDPIVLYSWESPDGEVVESGGTITYENGDGNRLNYKQTFKISEESTVNYYTICLNGKKANIDDATASANAGHMLITLTEELAEGDEIEITAFLNKNESKKASAWVVFEKGDAIDSGDFSDECNLGMDNTLSPVTKTITVAAGNAGSKTIKLTRGSTGTNLFITKLVIKRTATTHEHNFSVEVEKTDPTCTAPGTIVMKCDQCDETETQELDPLGHDFEKYTEFSKEPTCTEPGREYIACLRCGEIQSDTEIPALGHKFEKDTRISKEPTCTESGREYISCTICGEIQSDTEISALGHDFNDEGVCSRCGEVKPASGGDSSGAVTVDFTDNGYENGEKMTSSVTENGVTVEFGNGTNTSNGPAWYNTGNAVRFYAGNTMTVSAEKKIKKIVITFGTGDGSNDITTDVETYTDGTWEGESNSVTFTIGGTKGHRRIAKLDVTLDEGGSTEHEHVSILDEAQSKEPTCTESGLIVYVCSICGEVLSSETVEPLGHDFNDEGVCSRCGEVKPSTELEVPGTVIWSSDEAQTVDWDSGKSIVIPKENLADVKVGDVLNIGVLGAPEGANPNNWNYQIGLQDPSESGWKWIEANLPLNQAGDYVHSIVVTGDMLKLMQADGVAINGKAFNVKKVAVESKYSGSDKSIWVGDVTISGWNGIEVYDVHFNNANGFEGVNAGQIIRVNATPVSDANISLRYQGADTGWGWEPYPNLDANSFATETGYDIPISEDMVSVLKSHRMILTGDGGVKVTSIDLIDGQAINITESEGGTVTASPFSAVEGTKITLTATPDEGYELESLQVVDSEGNVIAENTDNFTMGSSDVTVTATFKKLPVDVDITVESGKNIAAEVAAAADGADIKSITVTLEENGEYTISSTLQSQGNVTINGAEGAVIDASGLSAPLITLKDGTTFAPKADGSDSDHILVESVTIKDVTIKGLKDALVKDAQKSLVETVTIDNSVIEMPAAGKNVLDFNGKGYAGKVIVKNSTIWSAGKNTGFFAQYGSRPKNVNGDLLQEFDFENSTIVNIANGKNFCDLKQNGTAQNVYTIKNNIFSDSGKAAGQVVVGFNKGQTSATPVWDVEGNTFFWDGADVSEAETSKAGQKDGEDIVKNSLTTDPEFVDAANGDFTVGEATEQAELETGDPRWLVPFDGGEVDNSALLSEIEEAKKLLGYDFAYYDKNTDDPGKALVDAIRSAEDVAENATSQKKIDKAVESLKEAEMTYANTVLENEIAESESLLALADEDDDLAKSLAEAVETAKGVLADDTSVPADKLAWANMLDNYQKEWLAAQLTEKVDEANSLLGSEEPKTETGKTLKEAADAGQAELDNPMNTSESLTDAYVALVAALEAYKADPTAIRGIEADETDAPVYNMAGQRVSSNAKGIVIKNGKKIIRK